MPRRIDHVAIVVHNLEQALRFYQNTLGFAVREVKEVVSEQVKIAFLPLGEQAGSELELIEPLVQDSSLAKFLERRGEGLHHICFEVDNVEAELNELKAKGVPMLDQQPRLAAKGHAIFEI